MKVLKDFSYSLDGIRPTSFKKDEVVRVSAAVEGKLVKAGYIGDDAEVPAPAKEEVAKTPEVAKAPEVKETSDKSEKNKNKNNKKDK